MPSLIFFLYFWIALRFFVQVYFRVGLLVDEFFFLSNIDYAGSRKCCPSSFRLNRVLTSKSKIELRDIDD